MRFVTLNPLVVAPQAMFYSNLIIWHCTSRLKMEPLVAEVHRIMRKRTCNEEQCGKWPSGPLANDPKSDRILSQP